MEAAVGNVGTVCRRVGKVWDYCHTVLWQQLMNGDQPTKMKWRRIGLLLQQQGPPMV